MHMLVCPLVRMSVSNNFCSLYLGKRLTQKSSFDTLIHIDVQMTRHVFQSRTISLFDFVADGFGVISILETHLIQFPFDRKAKNLLKQDDETRMPKAKTKSKSDKISKIYILTQSHIQGHLMWVKSDQSLVFDELTCTVQILVIESSLNN